jgi:hypothetical protein
MGTSTDALLWFGLCDDGLVVDGLPGSVTERLRETYNPEPGEEVDDEAHELIEHANKLLEPFGVELVMHQSSDYTRYGLAESASTLTAWRGYPKPIAETMAHLRPDATQRVLKAAELIGWHVAAEPCWWMASWWG